MLRTELSRALLQKLPAASHKVVLSALETSPDPDASILQLLHLLSVSSDVSSESPGRLTALIHFLGSTEYFASVVTRRGDYLFLFDPLPENFSEARRLFLEEARQRSKSREPESLHLYRDLSLARICFHDLRGASLYQVGLWLSALADALIQRVLELLSATDSLAVISLGKLGGEELNYSSDIDLLFLSEGNGETVAPRLIRLLSESTRSGYLFRVDARLRPHGTRGPLAPSCGCAIDYYTQEAVLWERQALLKARFSAGNPELAERFLRAIEPLVYRRYLSASELSEVRRLRIASRAEARNIKTGIGGIRDVEFIVQFLQLLYGGQYPGLRERNTLRALNVLEDIHCLDRSEAETLRRAYILLRWVENRLMTFQQTKVHSLPTGDRQLRKLAYLLEFGNPEALLRTISRSQSEVESLFEKFFGGFESSSPLIDALTAPDLEETPALSHLEQEGFRKPERALENFRSLAHDPLGTTRLLHLFPAVAGKLLELLKQTHNPDSALENFARIINSAGAKTVLYELLREHPPALSALVAIASGSEFLTDLIAEHPEMLDDLLVSLSAPSRKSLSQQLQTLAQSLSSPEPLSLICSYKNTEFLRIGLNDLLGRLSSPELTSELATLAEAILLTCFRLVGGENLLGVLAFGKLGARSLNYSSDLDLVFFCEDFDSQSEVTPLASRLLETLSQHSAYGRLYNADTRLRPEGGHGVLVPTLDRFRTYYLSRAQPWELLALTKARIISAPASLGRAMSAVLEELLYSRPPQPDFVGAIREIREKQASASSPRDIKLAPGGLAEIDFIAGSFALALGWKHPELRSLSTTELLQNLKPLAVLPVAEIDLLIGSYLFYQVIENKLQIVANLHIEELPDGERLERLAHSLGYTTQPSETLLQEVEYYQRRVRQVFESSLSVLTHLLKTQ